MPSWPPGRRCAPTATAAAHWPPAPRLAWATSRGSTPITKTMAFAAHARECYAELTAEERDWQGADLEAAREACHDKLDFAKLLPEVDRLLG